MLVKQANCVLCSLGIFWYVIYLFILMGRVCRTTKQIAVHVSHELTKNFRASEGLN